MAFVSDVSELFWANKNCIKLRCDECAKPFELLFKSAKKNEKKNGGKHICATCKGVSIKPQNTIQYWTPEKKTQQGLSVKNSIEYQLALKRRNTKGENNGMYGKKHSEKSRQEMSLSRTGKTGPNATAWKGGKSSLLKRIKEIIHRRHHWYESVFRRDKWMCVQCDSKKELDAHHVEPMAKIVKRLCENKHFGDQEEKFNWLIEQKEVIDPDIQNGITLCRECHKQTHENWGSHNG